VYHYFKSKEEIFFQLLDRALSTSGDSLLMVESMPISPLQKVRETAKYILGGIDQWEDTSYYFLIVIHAAMMDMTGNDQVFSKSQVAIDVMVRILEQGQELGEVKDGDPLEMSILFFAAIQGVAFYKLSMPNFRMPDPELLVSMVKK
jgi:AcrR family transcriptional regulator